VLDLRIGLDGQRLNRQDNILWLFDAINTIQTFGKLLLSLEYVIGKIGGQSLNLCPAGESPYLLKNAFSRLSYQGKGQMKKWRRFWTYRVQNPLDKHVDVLAQIRIMPLEGIVERRTRRLHVKFSNLRRSCIMVSVVCLRGQKQFDDKNSFRQWFM
jgi:hypothetical protein